MPSGALPRPDIERTVDTGDPHRVVVGVDGSEPAATALEWAARQAARTGAELEVVTTFGPEFVFVTPEEERQASDEVLGAATARVAGLVPAAKVTTKARRGSADQVLVDESAGAELLVVGTRGLGGFRGLALGSVGRKCVHRSRVPIVVVRGPEVVDGDDHAAHPSGDAAEEAPSTPRIVAGADGSPTSAAALEWAARQATLTGARLEVIMTWEWPTMYGWTPASSEYNPQDDCETRLAEAIKPLQDGYPDLAIQSVAIEGAAASLLVKASHGADLLAVGSRGHGEFTGLLLGSVSEHCAVHAHCPVLVHHSPT